MDNLEKAFDYVIKSRKEERRLKDEYFADIKKKSLDFINSTYEKLLFLNEKGFKVYKTNDDSMFFYIDYPYGIHTATSKITSTFVPYTYFGETHAYPRTDDGFIVDWFNRDDENWKKYKTLEELVKAYAEKVNVS